MLPIRILSSQEGETPDSSSQQLRCKILRDDVEDGALAVLSFHDARPRGNSHIDYLDDDEWTLDDLCSHLRFWRGALCLDTDYVRGRKPRACAPRSPEINGGVSSWTATRVWAPSPRRHGPTESLRRPRAPSSPAMSPPDRQQLQPLRLSAPPPLRLPPSALRSSPDPRAPGSRTPGPAVW